jgi:hypothetical protein
MEMFHNRIRIDYYKDNHYTELKDAEVLRERLGLVDQAVNYVGEYVSKEWIMQNIMQFTEEEMKEMYKQMENEIDDGEMGLGPHSDNAMGAEPAPAAAPPQAQPADEPDRGEDEGEREQNQ